jgi:energy-converting hydrogenase Eha subunit A
VITSGALRNAISPMVTSSLLLGLVVRRRVTPQRESIKSSQSRPQPALSLPLAMTSPQVQDSGALRSATVPTVRLKQHSIPTVLFRPIQTQLTLTKSRRLLLTGAISMQPVSKMTIRVSGVRISTTSPQVHSIQGLQLVVSRHRHLQRQGMSAHRQ